MTVLAVLLVVGCAFLHGLIRTTPRRLLPQPTGLLGRIAGMDAATSRAILERFTADRGELSEQTRTLHRIDAYMRHFREHPQNRAAIKLGLPELGFTDDEVRRLIARINQVDHRRRGIDDGGDGSPVAT